MKLKYIPHDEIKRVERFFKDDMRIFSYICRINALYSIKKAGSGHIGSSFSSLDIVSYLYLKGMNLPIDPKDLYSRDIYYSSKGHDVPGLYSILTALGFLPFETLHAFRKIDGLPGHPDIRTPFIPTNTGSLGMGISKAKGFLRSKKIRGQDNFVFVLLGDGELQEGQFWESLLSATNHNLNNIIAICDHNKIQSDQLLERVSPLGDLQAKIESFGWHVERMDGHNFHNIETCLSNAKKVINKPKFIIADTIKGKGVSFMENVESPQSKYYKFHSGAPTDDDYSEALNELLDKINGFLELFKNKSLTPMSVEYEPPRLIRDPQKLISHYSNLILKEARKNKKIIALDADLVLDTGLIPLMEVLPEQFIECGIAEMDMVSQAGALALSGFTPIVHSFACFLTTRANEQIFNNSTEGTKVIYSASLAGLIPAGPGHSHQSVRDIGLLASLPNLIMMEPATLQDLDILFHYAVHVNKQSSYLRLVSVPYDLPVEILASARRFDFGQGYEVTDGDDAIIFTYGPIMLTEALKASQRLRQLFNINLKVINLPWLNKVDNEWLLDCVRNFNFIFTLDNHFIKGGQGEFIASRLGEIYNGKSYIIKMFGLEKIPECGTEAEVLKHHHLDEESIAIAINKLLKSHK